MNDENAINAADFVVKLLTGSAIAACFTGLLFWSIYRSEARAEIESTAANAKQITVSPAKTTPASPKPPAVMKTTEAPDPWRTAPAYSHVYALRVGQTQTILNQTYGHISIRATDHVRVEFGDCHASPDFASFQFDCSGTPSTITITDARGAGPADYTLNDVSVALRY
jgi:hypothetical protein